MELIYDMSGFSQNIESFVSELCAAFVLDCFYIRFV